MKQRVNKKKLERARRSAESVWQNSFAKKKTNKKSERIGESGV